MEPNPSSRQDVDPQQVDRILRMRREQRGPKACYPCRQRKVKCDSNQPCKTCQRRNHPEICVYTERPERTGLKERSSATGQVSSPLHQGLSATSDVSPVKQRQASIPGPKSSDGSVRAKDFQTPLDQDVHHFSGDNSLASIIRHRTQGTGESLAEEIEPVLGLRNTYPIYPFMEDEIQQDISASLLKLLPQREEVLKYFHLYRTFAYPFSPTVIDPDELETNICTYLDANVAEILRQNGSGGSSPWTTDRSIAHISVILATLASGTQFSDLDLMERAKRSKEFARRSFQALRLANFLFRPSLEVIQALLILGNVLQNHGQSDATWALLGVTVRLAQTLGLHTEKSRIRYPEPVQLKRKKLWSIIIWQDAHLSLCHDRPPAVLRPGWTELNEGDTSAETVTYVVAMQQICRLSVKILNYDGEDRCREAPTSLAQVDNICSKLQPYLRDISACRNMQQRLEHLAFRIHVSFLISFICRPGIERFGQKTGNGQGELLRTRAKSSLLETVKAYLEFQKLSIIPMRTWSMIHAVLASTLLLGIWEETRNDPECRSLQQQVMDLFLDSDTTGLSDGITAPGEGSGWLSKPHIRALITLRNSVHESQSQYNNAEGRPSTREGHNQETGSDRNISSEYDFQNIDTSQFPGLDPTGMDLFDVPFDQSDTSPWTYLDSIMNVPIMDSQQGFGTF